MKSYDPTKLGEEVGYDAHFDFGTGSALHHGWGLGARASQLVQAIEPQSDGRHLVKLDNDDAYMAKAVIVTAGADYVRLGVPGDPR